jgi:predicted permease
MRFFLLFLEQFAKVLLPLLFAVASGWLLYRFYRVPSRPLSLAGMNFLAPALLLGHIPYHLSHHIPLLFLVLFGTGGMLFGAYLVARVFFPSLSDDGRRGFVLGSALSNFGFFGLPLVRFVLPPPAEEIAFVLIAFLNIPTGIVSAWIAIPGASTRSILKEILRIPFVWAVLLTLFFGFTGITLPEPLVSALRFCGEGSVPLMLMVLGIELAQLSPSALLSKEVVVGTFLRLLLFPAFILILGELLKLPPLSTLTAVLQLATPAGLTSLLYFTMFGRNTEVLTGILFFSTILAFFILPLWILFLGGA